MQIIQKKLTILTIYSNDTVPFQKVVKTVQFLVLKFDGLGTVLKHVCFVCRVVNKMYLIVLIRPTNHRQSLMTTAGLKYPGVSRGKISIEIITLCYRIVSLSWFLFVVSEFFDLSINGYVLLIDKPRDFV